MPPHNPHAPAELPIDSTTPTSEDDQVNKARVLSSMASVHTYSINGGKTVVPLRPAVKDYAWGIRGLDSRVARFALESGIIDEVDPDMPYAELWIGTHEKVCHVLIIAAHLIDQLQFAIAFFICNCLTNDP